MRFDKHLFISYSHIDNQPLTPQQHGWITRFHEALSALLSMRLGRKAEIWRDEKLSGNDLFADEILDQFERTAMLVSILTPRYLESEWCTREIREFCEQAHRTGGVTVENKARIFKVIKNPIDTQDALPDIVKRLLGYEFFIFEDGAPLELDPAYGERFAQDFNRKVGKLAWDVAQLLKSLEAQAAAAGPTPAAARPTVYLAECSHDRRDDRERLEADLQLHGYTVVPNERLPLHDEASYVAAVDALLARCGVSVHLVGRSYGAVPDGPTQKSVTVIQNEVAARHSRDRELPRLVWLPAGTRSDQADQQAFIDAMHTDAELQRGADLITGEFEAFKAAIHDVLTRDAPSADDQSPRDAATPGVRLVYLICDEKDRRATIPLRRSLKDRGIEVVLPAFEGSAASVRDANQKLFAACDAVVVFYGAGDEAWKRTTDNDLTKMKTLRADRAPAIYTYLAPPATHDKQDLVDLEETNLIDGLSGFQDTQLAPLIANLGSEGGVL